MASVQKIHTQPRRETQPRSINRGVISTPSLQVSCHWNLPCGLLQLVRVLLQAQGWAGGRLLAAPRSCAARPPAGQPGIAPASSRMMRPVTASQSSKQVSDRWHSARLFQPQQGLPKRAPTCCSASCAAAACSWPMLCAVLATTPALLAAAACSCWSRALIAAGVNTAPAAAGQPSPTVAAGPLPACPTSLSWSAGDSCRTSAAVPLTCLITASVGCFTGAAAAGRAPGHICSCLWLMPPSASGVCPAAPGGAGGVLTAGFAAACAAAPGLPFAAAAPAAGLPFAAVLAVLPAAGA